VQSIAYSPDGTRLMSTSRDRTVRIADAATGQIEATYAGHDTAVLTAIFSRDGRSAFSLAQSSPVQIWEAASGRDTKEKPIAIEGRPERLAWVSTGLAAGCADGLVRIYQVSDRQLLSTLYGHGDAVTALAVGRSSDLFATGSYDGTVCVWDLACGTWTTRFLASPR
jgi:WD40 repeat protein